MGLYLVNFNGQEHLVEANVANQAVMHIAASAITVAKARPMDVLRVLSSGGKVERVKQVTEGTLKEISNGG